MSNIIEPTWNAECNIDDNGIKKWTCHFILKDSEEALISPANAYTAAYGHMTSNRSFDGCKAKNLTIETGGDAAQRVWNFSIDYSTTGELGGDDGTAQTVVGTLRFSTKGGSTHINKSLQTRVKLPNQNISNAAPDFKGLINVQDNTPAGVDIQVPCLHVDVTAKLSTSRVTSNWLATYYNLTGKVNSDALWGFPAHTLIFRGVDGSTDGSGTCSLTFSFDFSPTVTSSYAPFSQVEKRGWEYLWVHNTLTTDSTAGVTVATPDGLYVEQVYEEASFSPFTFIVVW